MKKIILIAAASLVSIAAMAQPKFAHVNFAELVQLMPEADEARAQMLTLQQSTAEEFQGMVEEYQSKYAVYQQKAQTWTPAVRESKEKEIIDLQQRIQAFEQSAQSDLAQQQQALMAPIQQKAIDTVNNLAKKAGYIYVFDRSTMLYIDESQSVDITPAARKALNIKEGRTLESLQAELAAAAQQ